MALTEIGARLRLAGAPAFQKDAEGASSALGKMASKAGLAEKHVGSLERTAARAGKAGALFGGIIGGAAVVALKSAVTAGSDMNETLSKSQAVFGASAAAVKSFADDSRQNILLTKQAAVEGAASFGNLFVAMGIGQKPAATLSTKLVALASDLSSFNNVDTASALESLRSGLLGEAEPMRKFGVQLSATRVEAEAYALGLVKPSKDLHKIKAANDGVAVATANLIAVQKKHGKNSLEARVAQDKVVHSTDLLSKAMKGQKVILTAAQKAQASYAIIMADTKTAQGDAARTSGGYANATRILQKNISDMRTELGMKLLPIATRVVKWMNDKAIPAVKKFSDEFSKGEGNAGKLRDALQDVGRFMKNDVIPVFEWFAKHPDVLKPIVGGVLAYKAAMQGAAFYTKSMALWAPKAAAGEIAVGEAGTAAMGGLGPFAIAAGAVTAYELGKTMKAITDGGSGSNGSKTYAPYDPTARGGAGNSPGSMPLYDPNHVLTPRKVGPAANPRLSPDRKPGAVVRSAPLVVHVQLDKRTIGSAVIDNFEDRAARQ